MPVVPKLKYQKMLYEIWLAENESLGIIVTSDWKHRYMVVKGVRPNSQAHRLGIQRGDRIFEAGGIIADDLTMKVMGDLLRNTRHFSMTVLRKADTPYSQSTPTVTPQPTGVKGTRLDFGDPRTYCVKSNDRHFDVYNDMESSRQENSQMEHLERSEHDWDAMSTASSCPSEQDHFDRERMENMRTKFADLTNRYTNSEPRSASFCKSYQNRVQEDLKAMQERANSGEQFVRRYRVSNGANFPINRVADWVSQHPSFPSIVDEENKENIMPLASNIWMSK